MAISQAMCTSFKKELMEGTHNFLASGGNSFKLALYTSSASLGATFTDFADLTFSNATITANGCLIYNDTNSDKAVCVLAFGGDKTSTAGDFTIQFPTADASNAIIRIA
jgi:hypothetical protein